MKATYAILFVSLQILYFMSASSGMAAPLSETNDAKYAVEKSKLTDTSSVTHHTTTIGGKQVKYTATAGKLVMKDDQNKPKAFIFFVAYKKDGLNELAERPITFAFNGGPGSASVWLHLGMLGPQRIKLPDNASQTAPQCAIENNPYSLLDLTDLVFIDPVSTGFSRPTEHQKDDQFYGYQNDLDSIGQFIHDYVTKSGRWQSPKFLLGESYGGFRAAGLADYLSERYRMTLNGILMISPAINFQAINFTFGNDLPYVLFVPGYAATAWYHKMLPRDLQVLPLADVVKEATEFALNEYAPAMMKGQSLTGADRNSTADKLARYTGLSREYVLRTKLRVSMKRFSKELLRSRGRVIGRLDSRYLGFDSDNAGEEPEHDVSLASVIAPFTAAINDYVRNDLNVEDDRVYEIIAKKVEPQWNYGADSRFPDVSNTLRASMSANPHLKLFVASGYYDLATPPSTVRYCVDHLQLPPDLQKNISVRFYESGHMIYVHEPSLIKLRRDIEEFYLSVSRKS